MLLTLNSMEKINLATKIVILKTIHTSPKERACISYFTIRWYDSLFKNYNYWFDKNHYLLNLGYVHK